MPDFDLCIMDWKEDAVFILLFGGMGAVLGYLLSFVAGRLGVRRQRVSSSVSHFGLGCLIPLALGLGVLRILGEALSPSVGACPFTPDSVVLEFYWLLLPIAAFATYLRLNSTIA
jgi:hypothetical protein